MDHVAEGNRLFVEECYDSAARAYTKGIAKLMGTDQFSALFGRAKCRIEIGNIRLAISDLTQCVSLNPKHRLSNYYLGYYLMKQNPKNYNVLQKCKNYLTIANEANQNDRQIRIENALKRVTNKLETLPKPEPNKDTSAASDNTTATTNNNNNNNNDNNTNNNNKATKTNLNSEEKQIDSKADSGATSETVNGNNANNGNNVTDNKAKVRTIRDTWYQSPTTVTYTLYIKNLTKNDVKIEFGTNTVSFDLNLPNNETHSRTIKLFGNIIPDKCKFTVNKYKINCVLTKENGGEWADLEEPRKKTDDNQESKISAPWTTNKDWDKVNDFAKDELDKDKPEGDEALQSLFQKIYKDADDDQRRAMVKSFQTSNGTVLSTNWGDVKNKDYEGKDKVLPTGQDVRKWEY